VQGASIQHEHRDIQRQLIDQVGDHHIFGAQAGGLLQGLEVKGGLLQQRLRFSDMLRVILAGLRQSFAGERSRLEQGRCHEISQTVRANKGAAVTASPW